MGRLGQYRGLLVTYLAPQWRRVLLLALLLATSIALQLLNPQLVRSFIDAAQAGDGPEGLHRLALAYLGLAVAGRLCYVLTTYLGVDISWTATNGLRADLTLHCLRLDLGFHTTRLPGELMERIDGDTGTLANFLSQFLLRVAGNALLLAGVLALTAAVDWRLGLLLGACVAVTLAAVKGLHRLGVPAFKAWREASASATGFWEERLSGVEDIRANGAVEYTMIQHYRAMRTLMQTVRRAAVMGRVVIGTWEVLGAAGNAALFLLAAALLGAGSLSLGAVYLVYTYSGQLASIVLQISYQLEDLQRAAAAVERIRELYYTPRRIQDGWLTLPPGPLEVECQGLIFSYPHTPQPGGDGGGAPEKRDSPVPSRGSGG
ncbi:MAG TPA: ABC transporter ATP-binding protein, partial [Chloroflexota bacterium]|nr:ABC transporter ATP-binding protein [Chloroflexota bacterium]